MSLYSVFKFAAFRLDPEAAHHLSLSMLSHFPKSSAELFNTPEVDPRLSLKVGSMNWSFPVGLAAGLDKNGEAIEFFSRILFGAVEIGTVTPLEQPGNDKPRLFRYVEEESLRNRMGFNNHGMEALASNVTSSLRFGKTLGINLGKNKNTKAEDAPSDYAKLYQRLAPLADYLVINVSSPNTPGLRDLQSTESLKLIFSELEKHRTQCPKPLYLKISPDMATEDLDALFQVCHDYNLEGIIATNTTIMADRGEGGISGRLLYPKAQHFRLKCLERLKGSSLEMIGVGGFADFSEVLDYWSHGGRALQIYTSFIFQGPQILSQWQNEILEVLKITGARDLEELLKNPKELGSIELS
ncbi:MAG: dihydroorotate dehydrogenase (quinone) [Bdellovibrio sp. CG12_big_fil_rev_8_21_14_0_65_39_13]|nr:MAG: dihydroorotate dehydrogenase (quinone) [Bdellovibrio sp. CG22_combo_CG10-13_8_21_14_all_39_27]PIQ59265.1 MAG: dihydroorotate dehydrogenase (quinone) [Bdellovibrio sp. CG12_big_fil_rev_8_21_14_0_65_39_13]PIR32276.1 MAG: dihydroorotate dehydrogenase (quinone) [Bdellovibrio sp. CG11_big_fil_rev_8_21_14_0_20_39_38]